MIHTFDNIAIIPPYDWQSFIVSQFIYNLIKQVWYPSLVGSFMVSQQVFWYPNGTRTIIRSTNYLYSTSVILGSHIRYKIIDNLMNESLSFRTILTKVTLVTASVVGLILNSTCFVLGFPLATFILAHVLAKCHFEVFVALSRRNFLSKLDTPVCQTRQSDFDRLASMLLPLDS
jgi:hypothetical protein